MTERKALFGPAGNCDSFTRAYKSSAHAPRWLSEMGLDCYEYQCGRGVHIGRDTAEKIGENAQLSGIAMSLHAPYFINLSSDQPERIAKNTYYIVSAARTADWMGADRIVVHCGGLSGMGREQALANTHTGLEAAFAALEGEGLAHVTMCIETMGKRNTVGTVEEVADICSRDARLLPCIDFGHVNSRTGGSLVSVGDFERVFDTLEPAIGRERLEKIHVHFSKIEYGKSGEIRHLTLEDTVFGPRHEQMLEAVHKWGLAPRIICESAGTQAEDALTMKVFYNNIERG